MSPSEFSRLSIEELLQQVRAQKKGAWEEMLRRYQDPLRQWALQRTGTYAPGGIRASDVSQEAALSAFQRFSSFRGTSEGELSVWLEQVVHSRWVDLLRKATRQKRADGETLPLDPFEEQNIPALQHTPSQVSAQQENSRLLLSYFLQLPDNQREALSLHLLRGSSVEGLMARFGCSRDAMVSLLRRGMLTLVARMEGRAEDGLPSPRDAIVHNQLDGALALYFRQLEAGVSLNLDAFAADYPDCANELRSLLRWLETLRGLQPPE